MMRQTAVSHGRAAKKKLEIEEQLRGPPLALQPLEDELGPGGREVPAVRRPGQGWERGGGWRRRGSSTSKSLGAF